MKVNNLHKNLIIRGYEEHDLADCRRLWLELTEWHRNIYESPEIGGEHPGLYFDKHLQQVGAENIWVAEEDGVVVGLTGLIPGEEEAELEPVVITGALRGQGIGRRLVETVIQQARKSGVNQLKVRPVGRNDQAIQFFHLLGFDILGHIELFQEFRPEKRAIWRYKERLAGRKFKV
jgi:N-acetylglutamate synthase-like GNAT family acetyltransferase